MENIVINDFIKTFGDFYFDSDSLPDGYKGLPEKLGIKKLNTTNYYAEKGVMKQLKEGRFDKISLAWKSGKITFFEKDPEPTKDFIEGDYYIISHYGKSGQVDIKKFNDYCDHLDSNKDKIKGLVENEIWKEAYELAKCEVPDNLGPVHIINALFFITKGKAPIYDKYAHKAAKALLLDISPKEVYLGGNPGKNESEKVISMYREYMIILEKIFKDFSKEKNINGMFISRELDRALWVYGHSVKKY